MTKAVVSERPTLAEHLGRFQLREIAQKRLFGGYDVTLSQLLPLGLWLFSKGAIFGRTRREKIDIIAKMFVGFEAIRITFATAGFPAEAANNEEWVSEYLRKVASDGMRHYRNSCREDPESFSDLLLTSFAPRELDFRDPGILAGLARRKVRLGMALRQLDSWVFSGISLGANFPEVSERLWRQSYEKADKESWGLAWRAGVDIPKEPTPVPLEEIEQQVLVEVASYVTEYFPELLDPLDLRLH